MLCFLFLKAHRTTNKSKSRTELFPRAYSCDQKKKKKRLKTFHLAQKRSIPFKIFSFLKTKLSKTISSSIEIPRDERKTKSPKIRQEIQNIIYQILYRQGFLPL